jgi:hypothetical protein
MGNTTRGTRVTQPAVLAEGYSRVVEVPLPLPFVAGNGSMGLLARPEPERWL